MRKFVITFVFGTTIVLSPFITNAQNAPPPCGDRKTGVEALEKVHKEVPISMGLTSTGLVVEVFNNGETGTFTILVTRPDGLSCEVLSGDNWEKDIPVKKIFPGEKS